MALRSARPEDIPKGAIRLSRDEAVQYQLKIIQDWPKRSDVLFAKYGAGILGGAASIVSIYLNGYYRRKLRLESFGRFSSYVAIAVIPSAMCMVLHHAVILPKLILRDKCAVCTEMKASSIQAVFGCVLPSILAPAAGFSSALNYGTCNVPYITQPRKVVAFWAKLTVPIGNILFGVFLAQAFLAAAISAMERRDLDILNAKLEARIQEDIP